MGLNAFISEKCQCHWPAMDKPMQKCKDSFSSRSKKNNPNQLGAQSTGRQNLGGSHRAEIGAQKCSCANKLDFAFESFELLCMKAIVGRLKVLIITI